MQGGEFTKGELITLCSKGIHGRMNLDRAVFDAYIDRYIAAAVNFVVLKQYYVDYNSEGFAEINGALLGIFEDVPVQYNEKRKKHFVELPTRLMPIPMDRAIPYLGPMDDESNQFMLYGARDVINISDVINFTDRAVGQVEGNKVYISNLPDSVKTVLIKMLQSISDIGVDDIIGIPAGSEREVVNIVVEFFLGVRRMPENKLNDNRFIDAQ